MTANPTGSGGYILTCEGGVWVATISGATPTANEHLATKAYVDAAAGGGGCVAPGDACADKTLFAVMYCSTDVVAGGGSAVCTPLYVVPRDQSTVASWKSTAGANDITTESTTDGALNQAQISPIASFPAFKVCDDLTYGGHTDWYLPATNELSQMNPFFSLLNFTTSRGYWTSQEGPDTPAPYNTDRAHYAYFSISGPLDVRYALKMSTSYNVRCVRKD